MKRPTEPITITADSGIAGADRKKLTHPAFGQISASRSSGGHRALYDSDFMHNNTITIRLSHSELNRSLSNDWHFERGEIVEVELSEAQWATFVSSLNMGSGVPCTLRHIEGEQIPGLPEPTSSADQFGAELKESVAESVSLLDELIAEIDAMGLPKKRGDALKHNIKVARSKLNSNAPFVADQFDKYMEKTVERGKAEVHGYMTGVVMRAGIQQLNNVELPLAIVAPGGGDGED